jgi:hypothetical protein
MGFVCSSVAWDDLEMTSSRKLLKGVRRTLLHKQWLEIRASHRSGSSWRPLLWRVVKLLSTGNPQDQEETFKAEDQDGHTKDRTNMLPWDSCGPDCPVCAEFEK